MTELRGRTAGDTEKMNIALVGRGALTSSAQNFAGSVSTQDSRSSRPQSRVATTAGSVVKRWDTDFHTLFSLTARDFCPPQEKLLPLVTAALIAGVKVAINMMVYTSIIFNSSSDPELMKHYRLGLDVMLVASAIGAMLSSCLSRLPFSICTPQKSPAILLAVMAAEISTTAATHEKVPTLLWIFAINALMASCAFFVAYQFKLSKMLLFLPYPVLCAFLGSVGYKGIRSALELMSGVPFNYFYPSDFQQFFKSDSIGSTMAGIAFFLGLYNINTFKSFVRPYTPQWLEPLWFLMYMLIVICLFWLIVGAAGIDGASLRRSNWLFQEGLAAPFYQQWDISYSLHNVNFDVITNLMPDCATMVVLVWISAMLNINGLDASFNLVNLDKDQELLSLALCNLGVAFTGSPPVYHYMTASAALRRQGGTYRIAPIIVAALCIVLFFGGISAVVQGIIPKFFLGGVFLNSGWGLFHSWIINAYWKMGKIDFLLVLLALLVSIFTLRLIGALIISIVMASIMFLLAMGHAGSIDASFRGHQHRSHCTRSMEEEMVLDSCGSRILVLRLRGVLFFGSVMTIIERIRKAVIVGEEITGNDDGGLVITSIAGDGASSKSNSFMPGSSRKLRETNYVILDFRETVNMDAASADSIQRLHAELEEMGCFMLFSHLSNSQSLQLLRLGILPRATTADVGVGVSTIKELPSGSTGAEMSAKEIISYCTDALAEMNAAEHIRDGGSGRTAEYDVKFDSQLRGIFGKGLKGCNCFPYFMDFDRAMEVCENDLLLRFLYSEGVEKDGPFLRRTDVESFPLSKSINRSAKVGLDDQEFFNLPHCRGLPPLLKKYVVERRGIAGQRIFEAGEDTNFFYIIRQGIVEGRDARRKGPLSAGRRWFSKGAGHMEYTAAYATRNPEFLDHVSVVDDTLVWIMSREAMARMQRDDETAYAQLLQEVLVNMARSSFISAGARYTVKDNRINYEGFQQFLSDGSAESLVKDDMNNQDLV